MKKKEKKEEKISKQILLKKSLLEINKKYGIDTVHFASSEKEWEKISFGIPKVDEILGGGIARGRFSVIWGSPGSGKSTMAHYLTAQAQREGKTVYYIALEPFDSVRAEQFGVDLSKLIIGRFPIAEQSLDSIIKLTKEKLVDLIILDSVHSLSPKSEQEDKKGEKSLESDSMALLARKLSQFFRMAGDSVFRANTAVLLIGQTRTSIGFIAIEQLTGGSALKHNSVLTLHARRGQKVDAPKATKEVNGKKVVEIIGFNMVLTIQKTQTPGTKPELTKIHLPYYFESGFEKKEK